MKTKILLPLICLLFLKAESQTIEPFLISITGNSISNGSNTLEYATGEIAIETLGGSSFNCTQGLLQPNYDSNNGIETVESVDVNVYPNPASDKIVIISSSSQKLKTVIYDTLGKILGVYDSNVISLIDYPQGIFYMEIYTGKNKIIKSQSIVKI